MDVIVSTAEDFPYWLDLAAEVESLFGPMVDDADFHRGLKSAIEEGRAYCIRQSSANSGSRLCGGIVILPRAREIAWLAVGKESRGKGHGKALLAHALSRMETGGDVFVQTFDPSVAQGAPARELYRAFGFVDHKSCGPNSAGLPTVIMIRPWTADDA